MSKSYRYFFLVSLICAAALLYGSAGNVDETFSLVQHWAVCLMFLFWFIGVSGWAILLRKVLKLEFMGWPAALALSLVLHSFMVALIGAVGGLGYATNPWFLGWVILGDILAFTLGDFTSAFSQLSLYYGLNKSQKFSRFFLWSLIAAILCTVFDRLLRTQTPWGYTDPLFYQLLAPRYWIERGSIYYPSNAPLTMMASYWEYLHIWAFKLLSRAPGKGLIEVQIFAQLTHAVAYLACALEVERICRVKFKLKPETTLLATLAVLSIQTLIFTVYLAKNDWGTAFFVLVGAELLLLIKNDSHLVQNGLKQTFLAGLFLGFGAGAKYIHAPFIFTIVLIQLISSYRIHKKIFYQEYLFLGVAILFGILPFLLRNTLLTGNPLFPFYNHIFPPRVALSPGLLSLNKLYQESAHEGGVYSAMSDLWKLITSDFSFFLAPFAVIAGLASSRHRVPHFGLLLGSVLSLIIYTLVGANVEPRHAGVPLIILGMTSPIAIELFAQHLRNQRVLLATQVLFFLGLLSFSGSLLHAGFENEGSTMKFIQYFMEDDPANLHIIKYHYGGVIKAWLREHAPRGSKILMTGEPTFYYLPGLHVISFDQSADILEGLSQTSNAEQFFQGLHSMGFKYLGDNTLNGVSSGLSDQISPYLNDHPCLIAYQTKDSRVIDIEAISCVDPPKEDL